MVSAFFGLGQVQTPQEKQLIESSTKFGDNVYKTARVALPVLAIYCAFNVFTPVSLTACVAFYALHSLSQPENACEEKTNNTAQEVIEAASKCLGKTGGVIAASVNACLHNRVNPKDNSVSYANVVWGAATA